MNFPFNFSWRQFFTARDIQIENSSYFFMQSRLQCDITFRIFHVWLRRKKVGGISETLSRESTWGKIPSFIIWQTSAFQKFNITYNESEFIRWGSEKSQIATFNDRRQIFHGKSNLGKIWDLYSSWITVNTKTTCSVLTSKDFLNKIYVLLYAQERWKESTEFRRFLVAHVQNFFYLRSPRRCFSQFYPVRNFHFLWFSYTCRFIHIILIWETSHHLTQLSGGRRGNPKISIEDASFAH